jgi:hypothetical protein
MDPTGLPTGHPDKIFSSEFFENMFIVVKTVRRSIFDRTHMYGLRLNPWLNPEMPISMRYLPAGCRVSHISTNAKWTGVYVTVTTPRGFKGEVTTEQARQALRHMIPTNWPLYMLLHGTSFIFITTLSFIATTHINHYKLS